MSASHSSRFTGSYTHTVRKPVFFAPVMPERMSSNTAQSPYTMTGGSLSFPYILAAAADAAPAAEAAAEEADAAKEAEENTESEGEGE